MHLAVKKSFACVDIVVYQLQLAYDTLQSENVAELTLNNTTCSSSHLSTTSATQSTQAAYGSKNTDVIKYMESLSIQISELKASDHNVQQHRSRDKMRIGNQQQDNSRSTSHQRSNSSNRLPTCWYHRYFGTQAKKCDTPCDFPSQPPLSTRS